MTVYFFALHDGDALSDAGKVLGCVGLMMVYYRSFSHFRMIDAFTSLVGMVNIIVFRLFVFFFILGYFFVVSALLIIFLNPDGGFKESFDSSYVWAIFGGIGGEDFSGFDFAAIPIAFGTIIVMVVLLNILIALLSNVYCILEEQQISNDIREKAAMILDLELIVYFFRYVLTGKRKTIDDLDQFQDRQHARISGGDQPTGVARDESHPLQKSRRFFLVVKRDESSQISEEKKMEENIYKKVKNLSQNFENYAQVSTSKLDRLERRVLEQLKLLPEKITEKLARAGNGE